MRLGVFFPYFGAKFMRAPKYPKPAFRTIIEPFAGAAGYSVRNHTHNVHLIDASQFVCGVWDFLIRARSAEIRNIPLMKAGQSVDDLNVCQEAKWLLGFWINQGSSVPKKTMGGRASNRAFGTWGEGPRERLAQQVELIRHWRVEQGDYRCAPDVKATWFIDPPYQDQGKQYQHTVSDYVRLASWARSRQGEALVCESAGADWLPFGPVTTVAGASHRITQEMLWHHVAQ